MNINDAKLSKSLSWLLRHGAVKEGLTISTEGYVKVNDLLQHKSLKGKYNTSDIVRIVETNNKQRFKLRTVSGTELLEIKANQGHSISLIDVTGLTAILQPIYETVVHGTYLKFWPQIKVQGLSRMNRQHIHFAKGTLDDKTVISGLRSNVEVYIFVNLKKALQEGVKFFESENGVLLTSGDQEGFLRPKYFLKAIDISTGALL